MIAPSRSGMPDELGNTEPTNIPGTPSVAAGYGPMHLTDFATANTVKGAEFDDSDGRSDRDDSSHQY